MKAAWFYLLLILFPCVATASRSASFNAMPDDAHFDVYLNDKKIGWHSFAFLPAAGGYYLESRAQFDVRYLGINFYWYEHSSKELWADGCLREITSVTNDNGDTFNVIGGAAADSFAIRVNDENYRLEHCQRSFAYWQPQLLLTDQLINSQTGKLTRVEVRQQQLTNGVTETRISGESLDITLQYQGDYWRSLKSNLGERGELVYRRKPSEK